MEETLSVRPIGRVSSPRIDVIDDDWGPIESVIKLDPDQFTEDVTAGLDDFSHIDVVFHFDQVDEAKINPGSRHPRGREDWPLVGIFAQRAKARPNRLGVTTCDLVSVDGLRVTVRGLDAIHDTPVLDIKPHVVEFQARGEVRQPEWMAELMQHYW